MEVLNVKNLSKEFGGIKAVTDINLSIKKGELIGLIGPNGAGKTTFFNLLTGVYIPTSGDITYNLNKKTNTKELRPHRMAGYGISRTFQNIRLFKNISVLENILTGFHSTLNHSLLASFLKLPSYHRTEKDTYEEAKELLDRFDLLDKKDELARNLPYGDQRRLEIARAIAGKPKLLLLDEPAAGMNIKETRELTELIQWIRETFDLTVILIEHDMSLVMNICEKIYVFDYGHLIAEGSPEEVQENKKVIKAYLGEEEVEE